MHLLLEANVVITKTVRIVKKNRTVISQNSLEATKAGRLVREMFGLTGEGNSK